MVEDIARPAGPRYFGLLGAAVVLGVTLRVLYTLTLGSVDPQPPSDAYYFLLIAENLVNGQGYLELNARAYRPPGYPWFLAAVYAIAGVKQDVARLALCVVGGLHCGLFGLWAGMLASRRVGIVAAFATAVYLPFIPYPASLFSETLYIFLLALSLALLVTAYDRARLSLWALAGLAFGLTTLTREMTIVAPFVVAIWLALDRALTWPRWGAALLVFGVTMAMTIAPWAVRNYLVVGQFLVSTNSGINFYIGNSPGASELGFPWRLAPGVEWERGANELTAHRRGLEEGLRYVRQNPLPAARDSLKKAWILWRPPVYGYSGLSATAKLMRMSWLVCYLAALALALYGFARTIGHWRRLALPGLMIAAGSLPYVIAYPDTRYRVPMETLVLFYSAIGVVLLAGRDPLGDARQR